MHAQTALPRVTCLLVPLQRGFVVVPASTVVEIHRAPPRERWRDTSFGSINEILWRGQLLPLVALDGVPRQNAGALLRLVVMRTLSSKSDPRLYAIAVSDIPKMVQADTNSIAPRPTPEKPHRIANGYVRIQDEDAFIPDLESLEALISKERQNTRKTLAPVEET